MPKKACAGCLKAINCIIPYRLPRQRCNHPWSADPKEETILKGIPEESFTWSPNEDYLIYHPSEEEWKRKVRWNASWAWLTVFPVHAAAASWLKYNPATGISERLTFGNHSTYLNDISPMASISFIAPQREHHSERPFSLSSLYQVNLETLAVDTLFIDDRFMGSASYSPDGKQLLLTGSWSIRRHRQNCGNHPIANDFDSQAYIMDLAHVILNQLQRTLPLTVYPLQWNKGDGCIYFNTNDEDCRNIYRYSPQTKKVWEVKSETDVTSAFALSKTTLQSLPISDRAITMQESLIFTIWKEDFTSACRPHETDIGRDWIRQNRTLELHCLGRNYHSGYDVSASNFDPNKEISAYRILLWWNDSHRNVASAIPIVHNCLLHETM